MTRVVQGDLVRLSVAFTNISLQPADPTTVTFEIQRTGPSPVGSKTTYVYGTDAQLVRSGVGAYYVDFAVDAGGTWSCRFEGTGAIQKAEQADFFCYPAKPA